MLFTRASLPLASKTVLQFTKNPISIVQKSHLNSPFMEFFSLHKTTFLVAAHTGDQLNFIATQPKPSDSSPLPAQAINDDNDW